MVARNPVEVFSFLFIPYIYPISKFDQFKFQNKSRNWPFFINSISVILAQAISSFICITVIASLQVFLFCYLSNSILAIVASVILFKCKSDGHSSAWKSPLILIRVADCPNFGLQSSTKYAPPFLSDLYCISYISLPFLLHFSYTGLLGVSQASQAHIYFRALHVLFLLPVQCPPSSFLFEGHLSKACPDTIHPFPHSYSLAPLLALSS